MDKLKVPFEISELIFKKLEDNLNREEEIKLKIWLEEKASNKKLYEKITNEVYISTKMKQYNTYNKISAWEKITRPTAKTIDFNRGFLKRALPYAAAVLLLIGLYFFYGDKLFNRETEIAESVIIKPGTQKSILTLSSGEKIEFGNESEQVIINEKQVNIINVDNTLKYEENETIIEKKKTIYNILETPRGGEYKLVLSDGTEVWLNAESKLRYPTEFYEDKRFVEFEGEAYFKVVENKEKPFIVSINNMEIEVLGTSFNVMSYKEEESVQATLVEGKVRVGIFEGGAGSLSEIEINPGEQAVYIKDKNKLESRQVDTEIYTAWRDGRFIIVNESLEKLMRRLGRWYNFEADFTNPAMKEYHFSGTLGRDNDINKILKMIALTTNISFEIRNNTIIISEK